MTSDFPFKLTKELYELYLYKGELYQDRNRYIQLTPDESLLSFENALKTNKTCIEFGSHKHIGDRKHIRKSKKTSPTSIVVPVSRLLRGLFTRTSIRDLDLENSTNPFTEYKFNIGYGFGKETYYVVCEQEEKDSSPVWVRYIGADPLMFSKSLTLWILMIAEGYETGGYYIDKDGYFDVDYDKMKKIFYKYNPELSETWKYIYG